MLTPSQIADRRKSVGSSDVSAILGVSSWKTVYDLWLEKTGRIPEQPEKPWMRVGSRMEAGVLEEFVEKHGAIERGVLKTWPDINLACNVDAILCATGEPVEAKTAGLFGPLDPQWGDEGTDSVPREYVVQAHAHMIVCESDRCYVPTLLGGIGFRDYVVKRSDKLVALIIDRVGRFWRDNVVADVAPTGCDATPEIIKLCRRAPGLVAHVPAVLVQQLQKTAELRRKVENRYEQLQAAIRMFNPEAEAYDFGDPDKICTDYEQGRTSIDAKALKSAHPDIYDRFARESRYRVMRISKRAGNSRKGKQQS